MNKDYIQKTLTIVSFVLPTILFGICLFSTFFLADNIAAHFDSNNNVTRVGEQYELLILGFVYYLLPIVFASIFAHVNTFSTKVFGLVVSIFISLVLFGVTINILVLTFANSAESSVSSGLWVSFALSIIGFASVLASHILLFVRKNLFFRKRHSIFIKHCNFNKMNVIISVFLFMFGISVCIGCSVLKSLYSLIVFFTSLFVFGAICFFAIIKLAKKCTRIVELQGKEKCNVSCDCGDW